MAIINRPVIEQLCGWCNGEMLVHGNDIAIEELIIDTRKISRPEVSLFIPLKTDRRDGHDYIGAAYERGVRNFIISGEVNTHNYAGASFVKVTNTLVALQLIAAGYRKQFNIPVIGVTGSNGKTIVKEWLFQLLSPIYNTVRSPKSYNSQIGVPLSVWLIEQEHRLGIFEAGISQPGEMQSLERIIQPSLGVFTNVGEAHSEGFLNVRQKVNEKLILFRNAEQLVYCKDYPELNECIAQYVNNIKNADEKQLQLFTWSHKNDADLHILHTVTGYGKTIITAVYQNSERSITIPFSDPASIENAIHCWCVMLLLGIEQDVISAGMLQLQPVSMRLELRHGINDCTIINDTYNSDLTSFLIALDYLEQQKQHHSHTVILSDILQGGKPDAELYEEVADLVSRKNVQRFIGIGPSLYKYKKVFRLKKKLRSIFFKTTDDFLKKFHHITFDNEAILLKGARVYKFEKIAALLEQKIHQTVLSINLSNLTHNLNVFRMRLKPGVKTMAMVKAFSYGSGSYEIAHLLEYSGVDYLTVAYTDEGVALRRAGITMPIMVMSPDMDSFDRMIAWKLEPEIYSLTSLYAFSEIAKTLQSKAYPVHLKLDTGMHRLGFTEAETDILLSELNGNEHVKVASIFSHLAASEDPAEDTFTAYQAEVFLRLSDKLIQGLGYKPLRHICNSAAAARHPELHYDMIRLGIGLYGIDSSNTLKNELKQIGTLKTTIAQIKRIPAGETIGYGRKGKFNTDVSIATISIGYADGYPRALGNGTGYVLIHGKQAPIVGVVCMDMCMVDISAIPDAKEGDEVIVFGQNLPVTQVAQWANTISYEIMTGISQRVKRIYENEL